MSPTTRPVVYRDVTVFDGTGDPAVPGRSLVVEDDRIAAVVATGDLVVPEGAEVVDLGGAHLIPGLVDSHQHLATPPDRPQAEAWLRRMVYGGVTTIRDMADDLRQVGDLARACLVGEIPGPDIRYAALMAGPSFFDDPRTWQVSQGETPGEVPWMQAITDDTDLVLATALARGTHACAVKIYADLEPALVAAITAEAHRQGIASWAHLAVFPALPLDVVRAGVDVVSHASLLAWQTHEDVSPTYKDKPVIDRGSVDPDHPRIAAVLDEMAARGTILDVTASMWESEDVLEDADEAERDRAAGHAELSAQIAARAYAAGVPISTGSDYETPAGDAFPALHRELLFLHERAGIPAADVLVAATRTGARSAGVEAQTGTLEPGKRADFVVLDADPLADLRHLDRIRMTVKRGVRHLREDYR
ncbi:amidohydrolase family protein [Nocardioides mangrovi]|uniref:Amidohydrolase family protein n=1 Tax=Nocardioides mangrovi TaxID=2874580 RepID=A0ABS7U6U4_9ACTN|nr:amidohydrolase family protein [Nocardioides mangrovi]MBZ5736567.1 amidohydrolase family protein [Nocardioides mangrovi]